MRDSFVLYTKIRETIGRLTDEQKGILFQAILDYETNNEVEIHDPIVDIAFIPIRQDLDVNNKKWEEIREARSEAGKKSAEARKRKTNSTSVDFVQTNINKDEQTETNPTVNVNVNDNVNDNDNANAAHEEAAARKQVLERWNKTSFKTVNKIPAGGTRAERLTARIKEYGVDEVIRAVEIAEKSKYLHDQEWFNFDWFIRPNNFPKVIDGNYTDSDKPPDKPLNPKVHFESERNYDIASIEARLLAKGERYG